MKFAVITAAIIMVAFFAHDETCLVADDNSAQKNVFFSYPTPGDLDRIIVRVRPIPRNADGTMVDFEFSAVYDERKGTYLIEDEEKIAQILKTFEKCRSFSIVPKKPSYELTPAPTTGIEIYWQYKDGKQKRSDNELVRFSIGVPEKRTGSSYPERAYVQVPDSSPFGKRHAVKSWNGRIPIVMNQEDSKKIWKVVGLPDVDFYRVPFNRR